MFLILTALAGQALHGYGLITESGVEILTAETERMRRNAEAAAERLRARATAFRARPAGGAA